MTCDVEDTMVTSKALSNPLNPLQMKYQLWATGLTFAMFRVEKGVPTD